MSVSDRRMHKRAERVTVEPRCSIWRHGRCWNEGETLTVNPRDASYLVKRGLARRA